MTDSIRWVLRKAALRLEGITAEAADRIITEEQIEWVRNERLGISNDPLPKRESARREMILGALRDAGFDPKTLPPFRNGTTDQVKQEAKNSLVKKRDGKMTDAQFSKAWQSLLTAKEIQRK